MNTLIKYILFALLVLEPVCICAQDEPMPLSKYLKEWPSKEKYPCLQQVQQALTSIMADSVMTHILDTTDYCWLHFGSSVLWKPTVRSGSIYGINKSDSFMTFHNIETDEYGDVRISYEQSATELMNGGIRSHLLKKYYARLARLASLEGYYQCYCDTSKAIDDCNKAFWTVDMVFKHGKALFFATMINGRKIYYHHNSEVYEYHENMAYPHTYIRGLFRND